jgi:hypothetical protein
VSLIFSCGSLDADNGLFIEPTEKVLFFCMVAVWALRSLTDPFPNL